MVYAFSLSQLEIKLVSCRMYTLQSSGNDEWTVLSNILADESMCLVFVNVRVASETQVAAQARLRKIVDCMDMSAVCAQT